MRWNRRSRWLEWGIGAGAALTGLLAGLLSEAQAHAPPGGLGPVFEVTASPAELAGRRPDRLAGAPDARVQPATAGDALAGAFEWLDLSGEAEAMRAGAALPRGAGSTRPDSPSQDEGCDILAFSQTRLAWLYDCDLEPWPDCGNVLRDNWQIYMYDQGGANCGWSWEAVAPNEFLRYMDGFDRLRMIFGRRGSNATHCRVPPAQASPSEDSFILEAVYLCQERPYLCGSNAWQLYLCILLDGRCHWRWLAQLKPSSTSGAVGVYTRLPVGGYYVVHWGRPGAIGPQEPAGTCTDEGAVADTTIAEGRPNTNYGGDAGPRAMKAGFESRTDQGVGAVQGLVRFDVSGIPRGSRISEALLRLYHASWTDIPNRLRYIVTHRVTSPWSEHAVSWDTRPGVDLSLDFGLVGLEAKQDDQSIYGYYDWEVTDLVQSWVSGAAPNHGFLVRTDDEREGWRGFRTREDGPSREPWLVVYYETPDARAPTAVSTATRTPRPPDPADPPTPTANIETAVAATLTAVATLAPGRSTPTPPAPPSVDPRTAIAATLTAIARQTAHAAMARKAYLPQACNFHIVFTPVPTLTDTPAPRPTATSRPATTRTPVPTPTSPEAGGRPRDGLWVGGNETAGLLNFQVAASGQLACDFVWHRSAGACGLRAISIPDLCAGIENGRFSFRSFGAPLRVDAEFTSATTARGTWEISDGACQRSESWDGRLVATPTPAVRDAAAR